MFHVIVTFSKMVCGQQNLGQFVPGDFSIVGFAECCSIRHAAWVRVLMETILEYLNERVDM